MNTKSDEDWILYMCLRCILTIGSSVDGLYVRLSNAFLRI